MTDITAPVCHSCGDAIPWKHKVNARGYGVCDECHEAEGVPEDESHYADIDGLTFSERRAANYNEGKV